HQNRRPKLYYATQVGTEPPTIVVMCNDPRAFGNDYRRYLLSVLRDHLKFGEVPIKMYLQKRSRGDDEDAINR
ncbi:MAG: ribosome biogenesis GTPase Der, partial [Planctomycetota bacterium]